MCHLRKQKLVRRELKGNLRVANHELEVIVAVNACAEVLIVVLKLLDCHNVISLVSLPDLHEVGKDVISGLSAALEVGMIAHIVRKSDIINRNLTTAVLIEHVVGHVDHPGAAFVHVTSDRTQKLIEGKLSVPVGIEVLNNLGDFDVGELEAVVAHSVLELDGAQRAVSVSVHGLEHAAETSESVSTSLLAKFNNLRANLFEVADRNVLLHVWVANIKVATLGPGERNLGLLGIKVDVSFVAFDSLGLVEGLSEAT